MKRLAVFLNQAEVGTLAQTGGGLLEFQYKPAWLHNPDAVPLSRMLPLQPESFRGIKARAFFAGILPEEGPRRQIAAILLFYMAHKSRSPLAIRRAPISSSRSRIGFRGWLRMSSSA
jgi:HipA-like protein